MICTYLVSFMRVIYNDEMSGKPCVKLFNKMVEVQGNSSNFTVQMYKNVLDVTRIFRMLQSQHFMATSIYHTGLVNRDHVFDVNEGIFPTVSLKGF